MKKKWEPRSYQVPVVNHMMKNPRCAAWLSMGMGKTVSTLTALSNLYLCGNLTRPTLIIAPKRVAKNTWPTELDKWDHLDNLQMVAITGDVTERFQTLYQGLTYEEINVFTINYENIQWLEETLLETQTDWPFECIVLDESTKLKGLRISMQVSSKGKEFLRGQGSVRAKALAGFAHSKYVARIIELTGTPAPNGLKDLWGQIWFLDGGQRLGRSYEAFSARWFKKDFNGFGVSPMAHAQGEIEKLLGDICISIDVRDHFNIDQPIIVPVYVDLPKKARKAYDDMEKTMFMQLEDHSVEAFNRASVTLKCLQLASGAAYVDVLDDPTDTKPWVPVHDAKLEALNDIIEEAAGMPVLVAYHFRSDLARLKKAFPEGRYFDDSRKTEKDWNEGRIPVMFIHPASGGHGLNLQDGGNIIVIFSHWWDLEQYQQVVERIGPVRQFQSGHDRAVFIYHIIARDTVDEEVCANRTDKRDVQELLLEAMKGRNKT